jgi:hypothetical protein
MMARKFFQIRRLRAALAACLLLAAAAAFAAESPEGDELFLSAGGRDYVLRRENSPLVDKYVAEGDPTTVFWSSRRSAGLTVGGRERTRYVLIRKLPDEDMFILTADGRNYTMKRVIAASGAKYEDIADPATVFWSKGESVTLTVRGQDYPGYETWDPAGVIRLTDSAQ